MLGLARSKELVQLRQRVDNDEAESLRQQQEIDELRAAVNDLQKPAAPPAPAA